MTKAVGIDIGGTGIKGALVETRTGELLSDRIKLDTPKGGEPDDFSNRFSLSLTKGFSGDRTATWAA